MMAAIKNIFNEDKLRVVNIPINLVRANKYQPRTHFDNEALCELSNSIRQNGIIQPITVRRKEAMYEIIAGERRWRAAKLTGLATIPAIIIEADDNKSALLALVENLQRQDLFFFEEAQAYQTLIAEHDMTQEELGKKLGKSQSTIANKLRLLRFNDKTKSLILSYGLSERHARALLKVPTDSMVFEIINIIKEKSLNVSQTEKLIDSLISEEKIYKKKSMPVIKDIRIFTNTVKQAISMMKKNGIKTKLIQNEFDWGFEYIIQVEKNESHLDNDLSNVATL